MQPLQRNVDLSRKTNPFLKSEAENNPLTSMPTSAVPSLLGQGGGTVDSLKSAFSGMVDDGAKKKKAAPPEIAALPPQPGVYPGVKDITAEYGALADGKRASTQGVVLHRTESSSAASTLAGYKDRINQGTHIGAQYLIDTKGETSLVTPLDSMVSHSKGFSASTVGVEVVGPAKKLDPSSAKTPLRDQITNLNLSPEMEARLLGYNDKQLSNVVKWNGNQIYEDINGAQKRSVWNLSNNLAKEYGLDMTSQSKAGKDESGQNNYSKATLPDFSAHEHINPKALGEGEPMLEFLRERQKYPQMVQQAEQKLAEMRASGAKPEDIAKFESLVSQEQGTLSALNLDQNEAEMAALKAERDSGKPGEATEREGQRTDFYDNFYDRMAALKGAVQ